MDASDFKDLEDVLFRGFLTAPCELNEVPILFKSLTDHEQEWLENTYFFIKKPDKKFNYFIAYSIAQIEGVNLIAMRSDELIDELLEIITTWPEEQYYQVSILLGKLRHRVDQTYQKLEAYTYTEISRNKWASYKNQLLNNPMITGWPGTEKLGVGSLQQLWVSYNNIEDQRLQYDMYNDAARFIATVFNYKGMQPVNRQELAKREQEYERRKSLLMGEKQKEIDRYDAWGQVKPEHMSEEDLVKLLDHMVSGKKDIHDELMDTYEEAIEQTYLSCKQKSDAKMNVSFANMKSGISSSSKALTEEEVIAMRKAKQEAMAERSSENEALEREYFRMQSIMRKQQEEEE